MENPRSCYYKTELLDRPKRKEIQVQTKRKKKKKSLLVSSEEGNLRGNMTALCTTVKVMGYKKQETNKLAGQLLAE